MNSCNHRLFTPVVSCDFHLWSNDVKCLQCSSLLHNILYHYIYKSLSFHKSRIWWISNKNWLAANISIFYQSPHNSTLSYSCPFSFKPVVSGGFYWSASFLNFSAPFSVFCIIISVITEFSQLLYRVDLNKTWSNRKFSRYPSTLLNSIFYYISNRCTFVSCISAFYIITYTIEPVLYSVSHWSETPNKTGVINWQQIFLMFQRLPVYSPLLHLQSLCFLNISQKTVTIHLLSAQRLSQYPILL